MLRVINKQSKLFIRDDFTFDEEVEFGLNTKPAQGLYKPKWTGKVIEDDEGNQIMGEGEWVEGATQEEIDELTKPQPQEPTIEERLEETERIAQMTSLAFSEYVFGAMKGDY